MSNLRPTPRRWTCAIGLTAALVFGLKLYLALTTEGSADVAGFADHLDKIQTLGGIGTYYTKGPYNNPFNSPPFIIYLLRGLGYLAKITHVWFPFWLRLPAIMADVGSLILVRSLLARTHTLPESPLLLLLVASCPISIMVSGFHGNTDPLMIFFVLLSIFFLETRSKMWLAGLAFGLALNIKVAPLMFAPALFLYLPDRKNRFVYFAVAAATFLICSLPYLLMDPFVIAKNVFGYSSIYGNWGWTGLATRFYPEAPRFLNPPHDVTGIHGLFATVGRWVLVSALVGMSVWMNRRRPKPPLLFQGGLLVTLFLVLTPGFGIQYLVWLVPFVLVLGLWPTVICYVTCGLFQFVSYACWAYRLTVKVDCTDPIFWTMLVAWLSLVAILILFLQQVAKKDRPMPYWRTLIGSITVVSRLC